MRSGFAATMTAVGTDDPALFVLVGDIGAFGLRHFAAACPGRFKNVGIREQAMASAAAGLAATGFIPVLHSITSFVVERCFEQLKDDFCYARLPGNIVSVGGGIDYAGLGCTHHSYSDVALLKSLPGTQVFCVGSPQEFDQLFRATYRSGALNYFRLSDRPHGIDLAEHPIGVGRAAVVRTGTEVTLITAGELLGSCVDVAREIGGASCEVLYAPSIKPFDAETVRASVRKTRRVVVAEEHNVLGGLGDEVRRSLDNLGTNYQITSLGIQDQFLRDYGSRQHLLRLAGLAPTDLLRATRTLMQSPA